MPHALHAAQRVVSCAQWCSTLRQACARAGTCARWSWAHPLQLDPARLWLVTGMRPPGCAAAGCPAGARGRCPLCVGEGGARKVGVWGVAACGGCAERVRPTGGGVGARDEGGLAGRVKQQCGKAGGVVAAEEGPTAWCAGRGSRAWCCSCCCWCWAGVVDTWGGIHVRFPRTHNLRCCMQSAGGPSGPCPGGDPLGASVWAMRDLKAGPLLPGGNRNGQRDPRARPPPNTPTRLCSVGASSRCSCALDAIRMTSSAAGRTVASAASRESEPGGRE